MIFVARLLLPLFCRRILDGCRHLLCLGLTAAGRAQAAKTVGIQVKQALAVGLALWLLIGGQAQVLAAQLPSAVDSSTDNKDLSQKGNWQKDPSQKESSPPEHRLISEVSYTDPGQLTQAILLKEIELERFNTVFREISLHNDKWRGWRQLAYSLGNSCSTEAGLIDAMVLRYGYIQVPPLLPKKVTDEFYFGGKKRKIDTIIFARPARTPINRHSLVGSVIPQLTGNGINVIGPTVELGVNLAKYIKERREGMTPSQVRKRVVTMESEIDGLLSARQIALESAKQTIPAPRMAVYVSEGQVLQDIRELANIQFERYYMNAKQFSAFQLSAYTIDWWRNVLGGAGGIISIYSAGSRKPHAGGTASLFTTLSGVGALAIPAGSTLASYLAGRIARSRFADLRGAGKVPAFEESKVESFEVDVDKLVKLAADSEANEQTRWTGLDRRLFAYVNQSAIYNGQEGLMVREIRQDLDTTLQTFMVAGMGGTTKIANGITGMIGGWHYYGAAINSSSLAAAGVTTYASGTGAQILETIREKVQQQRTEHRLGKQGLLPTQLRAERLQLLDEMRDAVK